MKNMKIRSKLFFIIGAVLTSLVFITILSIITINEISVLRATQDDCQKLISSARNVHGLMKDLVFDIFSPGMYTLLKDLIYVPRLSVIYSNWSGAVDEFKISFNDFVNSRKVRDLLKDPELKDIYDTAIIISDKAFSKIESLKKILRELEESEYWGGEDLYKHIQTNADETLSSLFEELRSSSYYFTNNFEGFLNYFIESFEDETKKIQSRILLLFWVLTSSICLITFTFTFIFSNRIAKRIKIIEKTIRQVSKGDFGVQSEIKSHDEFRLLSDNLNIFIKDLKSKIESILNLMRDVGNSISNELDFSRILDLIVESTIKDTNADGAAILLSDENNDNLEVKAVRGMFLLDSGKENRGTFFNKQVFKNIMRTGKPLHVKDINQNKKFPKSKLNFDSIIAVPLIVSRHAMGIIIVIKAGINNSLNDLDYTNLCTFADYTALTIDNYFKYTELLRQREVEFEALQSQIQPHFLYNVLSSLIGINRMGDKETLEKAVYSLQGMLRYILKKEAWTTVKDEFQFLKDYCDLQKIRFHERLNINMEMDENIGSFKIPKLLLQPLVENAIIHGIEPLEKKCILNISAKLNSNKKNPVVTLYISDNGKGFNPKKMKNMKNIGISNVKERLLISYKKSTINITGETGKGTEVTIKIPEKDSIR
jgi:sensor histidine kinase YesM